MSDGLLDCVCGEKPEIHSRLFCEDDIFDGIVCPHCEIGAYSGDFLGGGDEAMRVKNEWNDLIAGMAVKSGGVAHDNH